MPTKWLDHAGNANHFAASTVLLGAREHAYAFSPNLRGPYRPRDYAALRDSRTILVDDRHDVFGDGSVVVVAAPGHTPGHQVLVLTLPDQQPQILVGDAVYAPEDLARVAGVGPEIVDNVRRAVAGGRVRFGGSEGSP